MHYAIDTTTFNVGGGEFRAACYSDDPTDAPWEHGEPLGAVRGVFSFGHPEKSPGERVIHTDRRNYWIYDFAGAVKKARAEGMTGERAVEVAEAEMANFAAWLGDEWFYMVVEVELLDADGEPTGETETLGGAESEGDYWIECAKDLASEINHRVNTYKQTLIG